MTRVVLADDHDFVRVGIARLLSRHADIQVVGEAKNGLEAVECVERFQPDVLVLDMEMPGLNGLGVLRQLRQKGLWVNVLVLSTYDSPEYIRGVKQAGALGYLLKEHAIAHLVEGIRNVARGEEIFL